MYDKNVNKCMIKMYDKICKLSMPNKKYSISTLCESVNEKGDYIFIVVQDDWGSFCTGGPRRFEGCCRELHTNLF